MTYVIRIKNKKAPRPERFGSEDLWFVHPGAQKFNPNHRPGGDERGGEFTSSDMTGSAEFKAWFGDSKVVDENGKPLKVYHGTDDEFDVFDPGKAAAGLGLYVTPNKEFAQEFGDRVIEGYLAAPSVIDLDEFGPFPAEDDLPAIAELLGVKVTTLEAVYADLSKVQGDVHMFSLLENSGRTLKEGEALKFQDWGSGSGEPAFVFGKSAQFKATTNNGDFNPEDSNIQRFNPHHRPGGDDRGGEFTSGPGGPAGDSTEGKDDPGSSVYFEVAPDPNDEELTKRWNKLTDEEKAEISRKVAADITPEALKQLKAMGHLSEQIGGYMGATNPSLALQVDPKVALKAAHLLGYALSQDSMMVVSGTKAKGFDEVGAVVVHLPSNETNMAALTKHYNDLYTIEENGERLVGGFTASGNQMVILNFSGASDEHLASLVDKQLGGEYSVHHEKVYAAFPQKKDYGNASGQEAGKRTAAVWRKSADRLRREAADAIQAELQKRKKQVARSARRIIRRVRRQT